MEKWEIEVKEHWNKLSDSEWYQSLRTDDRLSELYNNPETALQKEFFVKIDYDKKLAAGENAACYL